MADQRPWFKLWGTCLTDPDLQNLSLENWGRWVRLGVYIKLHGTEGKISFKAPYTSLKELFKLEDLAIINVTIGLFPHVILRNDDVTGTMSIEFHNWRKYQYDSSASRVKKWRDKRNALEEKRSRREREESDTVSFSTSTAKEGPYV